MRGDIRRVLIVCPSGLTRKWQAELQARFNEEFTILDGDSLQQFFDHWSEAGVFTSLRGICSTERMRQEWIIQQIKDLEVQFDLVIVDEAHHMRNPKTLSFDLGEVLTERSDAMVLLTATPVQLHSNDLFYLLNILDPGTFERPEFFEQQMEPNRYINRAIICLNKIPSDVSGSLQELSRIPAFVKNNPYYLQATNLLKEVHAAAIGEETRRKRVEAITVLQKLNALSFVFNRTRRAEVGSGKKRVASVVEVSLTDIEKAIYEKAMEFARSRARHLNGYSSALGLIQIERQMASSLGAFHKAVQAYAKNLAVDIEIEESSSDLEGPDSSTGNAVGQLAGELRNLYSKLGDRDSKYDVFLTELQKILTEHDKVIVFSFFKNTLRYLDERLRTLGYKVAMIHGDIDVANRERVLDNFKTDTDKHILLSSEVGAEGQDFQFCDAIINYDLPWNPMRVEQRIGRVDRYGQQSDKVVVASFFLKDTIEERILGRLYDRIGVFRESIGELEPILGSVVNQLSFEAVSRRLSPTEEVEMVDRKLNEIEHKKINLREFENSRYELIGQDSFFTDEVRANIESGKYVSANEVKALLLSFLSDYCPRSRLTALPRSPSIWSFVPDRESFEPAFHRFLTRPDVKVGQSERVFLNKLDALFHQGGPHTIPLTFDSEMADARRLLEFVNLWHPLARMAVMHYNSLGALPAEQRVCRLICRRPLDASEDEYGFSLFYVESRGVFNSCELVPVVIDKVGHYCDSLSANLLKLFHEIINVNTPPGSVGTVSDAKRMSLIRSDGIRIMASIKEQKEAQLRQRNESNLEMMRVSTERTFNAKIRRAEERRQKTADLRILRMYDGEIRNWKARLSNALTEIETKRRISVTYEPVGFGFLSFVG